MNKPIDLRQTLKPIREFLIRHQRPPSVEEIRKLFGYRSKSAAAYLIEQLRNKRLISKDKTGRITLLGIHGLPLLGSVQAGWPSPAEEELVDTLSLDDYLIRNPHQSFLIKVTGDSMVDAGIHPGDLVIVERGRTVQNDDIVIAQVDGEWTLKYYQKRGSGVRLVPANSKYPIITPKEELKIGGVVVSCIRRYK